MTNSAVPHRVVILGGGFGGLSVALRLKRAPVQVTLIDRCNYHLFQPLLGSNSILLRLDRQNSSRLTASRVASTMPGGKVAEDYGSRLGNVCLE